MKDRRARHQGSWGLVSLGSAIVSPGLISLPFLIYAFGPTPLPRWMVLPILVGSPLTALIAVVAGSKARREPESSLPGRIGFVLGLIEISLIALFALAIWALQDQINESI